MKRCFTFVFVIIVFSIFGVVSVSASEIEETNVTGHSIIMSDYFGNEVTLGQSDIGELDFESISTFSYSADNTLPPAPHITGQMIPEIASLVADAQIPDAASFIFIDYGPNWASIISPGDSNVFLSGRYAYLFYGEYDLLVGRPYTGGNLQQTGHECYQWVQGTNPDNNSLKVFGPYALLTWNEETNDIYTQVNVYDQESGGYYSLTFEGIVSANDISNSSYYPKVITFGDVGIDRLNLGSYPLTADFNSFAWNISWDGESVHPDNENTNDFWDDLLAGNVTSTNPVVQYLGERLVDLANLIESFKILPERFNTFVSVLPPVFADFLRISFGLILGAFLVKFAINVLKR